MFDKTERKLQMEKILDKLDSYKILNYIFPGIIFSYLFQRECGIILVQGNLIEDLFIYYFIGLIISRIGSLVVEPICKKVKWVVYEEYADYIIASQKDTKIDIISEKNNMFRTLFAGCIILLITKLCLVFNFVEFIQKNFNVDVLIVVILTIICAYSYRKQTKYVAQRVRNASKNN